MSRVLAVSVSIITFCLAVAGVVAQEPGGDDLTILARALGQPVPPQGSPADLNADGIVDLLDLSVFADLWLLEHEADLN